MSLVGTLAKVAVGIAVAKGLKSMTGGGASQKSGGGLGDMLGGALGGGAQQRGGSAGGLGDILGQLGGQQQSTGGAGGGIGDLLGQLGGQQQGGGAAGGGIGDLLGSVLGGGAQQGGAGGGLGDLMGGLARGGGSNGGLGDLLGQLGGAGGAAGGLGGLLTNALENQGQVTQKTTQSDEDSAALMIRAMLQAAKADGQIDEAEKEKLLGNLGDLDANERAVINQELNRGIDVRGLAQDTPRGMAEQVYAMSVMAIDLDTQDEASYLHDLAQNMGLDRNKVNHIHQMMGARPLYG